MSIPGIVRRVLSALAGYRKMQSSTHLGWRRSRTGEYKSFTMSMVASLVHPKLVEVPVRLEETPKGKVGQVFVRLVVEGLCV
mgnify:CR=1 FL=1